MMIKAETYKLQSPIKHCSAMFLYLVKNMIIVNVLEILGTNFEAIIAHPYAEPAS